MDISPTFFFCPCYFTLQACYFISYHLSGNGELFSRHTGSVVCFFAASGHQSSVEYPAMDHRSFNAGVSCRRISSDERQCRRQTVHHERLPVKACPSQTHSERSNHTKCAEKTNFCRHQFYTRAVGNGHHQKML